MTGRPGRGDPDAIRGSAMAGVGVARTLRPGLGHGLRVAAFGPLADERRDPEPHCRDRVQLDGLRQEMDAHAKTDAEQLARLKGAVEDQQRLQEAHGKSIEKLALLASQAVEDLIFAEVAYLLGIAQQRLSFERDVPTAIRAMEAADQRLLNLIRPDLETVRAVLMADINDLRAVPVVDTTGPALYLADVLKRIDSLPFQGGLSRASDEDAGKRRGGAAPPTRQVLRRGRRARGTI